jgi:hypothetical protein
MKQLALLFTLLFALFACREQSIIKPYREQLRVKNNTPYPFSNITIQKGESTNKYGPLRPNQMSEYQSFSDSGYPTITIEANDKIYELKIMPIDFAPIKPKPTTTKPDPLTCIISFREPETFDVYFEQ